MCFTPKAPTRAPSCTCAANSPYARRVGQSCNPAAVVVHWNCRSWVRDGSPHKVLALRSHCCRCVSRGDRASIDPLAASSYWTFCNFLRHARRNRSSASCAPTSQVAPSCSRALNILQLALSVAGRHYAHYIAGSTARCSEQSGLPVSFAGLFGKFFSLHYMLLVLGVGLVQQRATQSGRDKRRTRCQTPAMGAGCSSCTLQSMVKDEAAKHAVRLVYLH